jgi:NTP pyrophosphatase (non-canonical NTP hydrolase)
MSAHEKAVEAAMNTLVRTDGAYPDGEPTAHLSDWFDLDAKDAMEFGALAEPKWHSYSDIRVEQYEAYIAAVLKAPFTAAITAYLASMREQGWAMRNPDDYFDQLVIRARAAAEKAARKFPQPNYVTLKIAEEAGEVVRGCVHYAEKRMDWSEVEGEIVQLLAMLIRLVTEGDQINGVTPPAMLEAAKEGQP